MKSSKRHSDYCRNLVIAGRPHVAFCMSDECPICLAYQRGREDAAEAILDLHCDLHDDGPNEECLVRASSAAAAALGDGAL